MLTGGPYSDHGIVRRAGRRRYGQLLEGGVEIAEYCTRMIDAWRRRAWSERVLATLGRVIDRHQ